MGLRFYVLLALFFYCILQATSYADDNQNRPAQMVKGGNRRLFPFVDCDRQCKIRCGAHSRPNVCNRACRTCCLRCKCVPPGTYGNREACGKCYTDMVTHGNKPKCP